MRLSELNQRLTELRRSEREKASVPDKFEETGHAAAVNFLKGKDLSKYGVTMTTIPKVGVNPGSEYGTPLGIYFYPADYYANHANDFTLPFQHDAPYIQILELTSTDILNLKKMTAAQYQNEVKKLLTIDAIKIKFQLVVKKAVKDAAQQARVKTASGKFWYVLWVLSARLAEDQRKSQNVMWNWLIRQLGYKIIIDDGTGVIHGNEPTQGVIIDPKGTFKWIKTINNRSDVSKDFYKSIKSFSQLSTKEKIQYLNNLDTSLKIKYVIEYPILIRFFSETDVNIILEYTGANQGANRFFKYVINPSEKTQLVAVNKNGLLLKYIKNPSEKVQRAAVKSDPSAIEYTQNPTRQMQLSAVKYDGLLLKYIKNPDKTVQLAAVKSDGNAIQFIENPSEQLKLVAVRQNGWSIKHIQNPSEKVQLAAVKENSIAIKFIENPSEDIQLLAVRREPPIIQHIKNPSEAVQLAAVNYDGFAIKFIKNPSEAVQEAALSENPYAISEIQNPSLEMQLFALRKNSGALQFIMDPTKQLLDAFVKMYNGVPVYLRPLFNHIKSKLKNK